MTHVVRCWCTWSGSLTGWWWYGGTTLQAYINIRVVGERTVRRANRLVPYHTIYVLPYSILLPKLELELCMYVLQSCM